MSKIRHYEDDDFHVKKLFECSCGTEGIVVDSVDWGNKWQEIWLDFYRFGHDGHCKCLRCRLTCAWHGIRYGHNYNDMVSLEPEMARKLAEEIIRHVEYLEGDTEV